MTTEATDQFLALSQKRSEAARKANATRAARASAVITSDCFIASASDGRRYSIPVYQCQLVRDTSHEAETKVINSIGAAAEILRTYLDGVDREHLVVLLLDHRNQVIGINTVSIGGLGQVNIDMKQIFKPAMIANAAGIILSHNHPSGDPEPSGADVKFNRDAVAAGKLLDIDIVDHIIIGDGGPRYYSMKEHSVGGY